jgi:hypothetical protein
MAAAPKFPLPENPAPAVTVTISVDSTFTPTPQGKILNPGDTLMFQNNSGSDITIEWDNLPNNPPLGANFSVSNGSSDGIAMPNNNAAGNYHIYSGGVSKSGPWPIQVGSGCMYISVTYNGTSGQGDCTPEPVSVPKGGNLEMFSTDYTYNVGWRNVTAPPFGISRIVSGSSNNNAQTQTGNAGDYSYTVSKVSPALGVGSGGGTVKVRGTS